KSARLARNTQLILQNETGVMRVADPLAGSYYVESLTAELVAAARALMEEVEAHGGMTKAVAEGLPKARIEEAAAEKQARVDRGETVIVGVNKFAPPVEEPLDIRVVDNHAVRETQVEGLRKLRANRDESACKVALKALTEGAKSDANLLALAIDAARTRATLGEISSAMEAEFGRFQPITKVGRGVYEKTRAGDAAFIALKEEVAEFNGLGELPPSLLVVKLGQDGHDRGAKVIASGFADLGFDVASGPLFQTPAEAAELAIASKVDVVGFSSLTAGHMTLGPERARELKARGSEIIVVAGGVIPEQDYAALYDAGIAAIFGPGTDLVKSASAVLTLIRKKRGRNW
ncbi:MAG: methylmalonyl-CoA mutase family protein, partial [Deltaproteobacteria bacterium]